jgi:LysM repeat protein
MKTLLLALVLASLLLAPALGSASADAAGSALADTTYVVQRGDTLYRIALRFGVPMQSIVTANHILNPNRIYVGQRLVIPAAAATPRPPASSDVTYVVQRGDTLWAIARRFGSSVDAIRAANGLVSNLIYPGMVLRVPAATPVVPPPTPTLPGPTPTPCTRSWFFEGGPASQCPASAPIVTNAAVEQFEYGLAFWLEYSDTFYFLLGPTNPTGANQMFVVPGPLRLLPGGSLDHRVGGAPPLRYEPVSGFGVLWRGEADNMLALRRHLGWAMGPEYAHQVTIQCAAYPGTSTASPDCYLQGPNSRLYHFYFLSRVGYFWTPIR